MPETNENKTFDFATAVQHLLQGRSVRVVDWNDGIYICFIGSLLYVFFRDSKELNIFHCADFTSSWELYNG